MATAVQKITLSSSRDIPFNKLVLAQSNVRRIKAGVSIEDLAASIARRGLIQSLHVRPLLDAGGDETGIFEVPAGGRRYRALEMLVSQKRLARTAPVPCVMGNNAVLAEEVSLAENIDRVPLHPLDAYRAFKDMRDKGMSEEEIAAAFFISVTIVKQRLKLTAVSPALLDVYADAGMTIAQLEAFSVSDDHARQEQVWEAIKNSWSKEPYQIRRMLTENTVRASDKRSVFVGLDAYEAAGGQVLRDLFQSDDGGWLQDALLLDRLVAEKLLKGRVFQNDIESVSEICQSRIRAQDVLGQLVEGANEEVGVRWFAIGHEACVILCVRAARQCAYPPLGQFGQRSRHRAFRCSEAV